jgi:hypothetical protein
MPDGERIRSTSLYTWARLPIAERGWRSWRQAHLYRLEIKVEDRLVYPTPLVRADVASFWAIVRMWIILPEMFTLNSKPIAA